jgi:hypothetical protein
MFVCSRLSLLYIETKVILKLSLYLLGILALGKSFAANLISDEQKRATIESLQAIQLLSISDDLFQRYQFLAYGEGKKNHNEWFIKRAYIISEFIRNREEFKVPEYAVVLNELIKYINRVLEKRKNFEVPLNDKSYQLFIDMFESLNGFVESVRSDQGYQNLKYQEVIRFIVKVSLFTKAYESSKQNKSIVAFLSEVDKLDLRHIVDQNKIENYFVSDQGFDQIFNPEHTEELRKIHFQDNTIKVYNGKEYAFFDFFPTKYNYLSYPFYFVLVGKEEHLSLEYFKSLPFSHFLYIPYRKQQANNFQLLQHLESDAIYTLRYLEKILDIDIIKFITSDSPYKYVECAPFSGHAKLVLESGFVV